MTPNPVVLRARDTVGKAITLMAQGGYRRLPIVDDLGRPTGILTVQGIMHYLVEHFPAAIYNLPPVPHHSFQQREGA
jgi:CBS domain-containing protein